MRIAAAKHIIKDTLNKFGPNKFLYLFAGTAAFAGTLFGAVKDDTEITFDDMKLSQNGDQILSGNVILNNGKLSAESDKIIFETQKNNIKIPGGLIANYGQLKTVAGNADYDTTNQKLLVEAARGNVSFVFFEGKNISGGKETLGMQDAAVYYAEPDWSSLSLTMSNLEYFSETERVHFENPCVRIAGVPVLPLPSMTVPKFERPPVRGQVEIGQNGRAGLYFRSTAYLTIWKEFEPGMLLDFNSMAGPMAGPAFNYKTGVGENKIKGSFLSGYINDTCNRGDDVYKHSTTGNRGFIDWFHKQNHGKLDLTASFHYWSDSAVVRDYRKKLYNENQNPDNYIEAVLPAQNDLYISALTRFHINKFNNTQERLPEIRADWLPAGDGIFKQTAFLSFASLREQDASTILPQHNHGNDTLISNRFDLYYGLAAPVKAGDFFSFTPTAGIRETFYANTVPANGNASCSRTLGQIGFDLAMTFSGTNGLKNETWNIDGLRHVFRPVLQYRFIAGLGTQDLDRTPAIDREFYLSKPSIIDISDTRAVDQIYDRHVIRLGFENLFQTRDKKYGSRDLAEFNIYQDWRDTSRPNCDNRPFSDNFFSLVFKPAPWVNFDYSQRTDVYDFNAKSIDTGVSFIDGNLWKLRLGLTYLENPDLVFYGNRSPEARQYTIRFDYRVSSRLTAYADMRYDDLYSWWSKSEFGLYHRISNSWILNYYWDYSKDLRNGSDVSFGVTASLVIF